MTTLMRNGRDRRSENPLLGHARIERVQLIGTDQRITSGPAATAAASHGANPPSENRPNTWLHPNASQKVKFFSLAPRAPHGANPPSENRPNTWLHPNASQKVKFFSLAPRAPSIHGHMRNVRKVFETERRSLEAIGAALAVWGASLRRKVDGADAVHAPKSPSGLLPSIWVPVAAGGELRPDPLSLRGCGRLLWDCVDVESHHLGRQGARYLGHQSQTRQCVGWTWIRLFVLASIQPRMNCRQGTRSACRSPSSSTESSRSQSNGALQIGCHIDTPP